MNLCGSVSFWLQVPQHWERSPCSSGLETTSYGPEKSVSSIGREKRELQWSVPQSGIFLTIAAVAALGTFATYSSDTVYNHNGYCLLLLVKGESEVRDNPKPRSVLCILSPRLRHS